MNKTKLTFAVSEGTGLSMSDSSIVVNAFLNSLIEGLITDKKVIIPNFGSFNVISKSSRNARNPKTGEHVVVPARKILKFKPSSKIKNLINE